MFWSDMYTAMSLALGLAALLMGSLSVLLGCTNVHCLISPCGTEVALFHSLFLVNKEK